MSTRRQRSRYSRSASALRSSVWPLRMPDFIDLNPLAGKVSHIRIKKLTTSRAKFYEQLQDGMLCDSGHANRGVNRAALDEALDHLSASFRIHPVHVFHYACSGT